MSELNVGSSSVASYISHAGSIAGKTAPSAKGDMNAEIKGLLTGTGVVTGIELSGIETYVHESAHEALVKSFYNNSGVTVQIDSFDNIRNFINEPTAGNLGKALSMYDVNQDGASGVTHYSYGDGPSHLGEKLGASGRQAAISAAGCMSTLIPDMIGFAAGFKLRKKHPILGYSLMTVSGIHHLANSSYPISAAFPGPKSAGHDWVSFAKATGVHPAITASVFALSLPALAAGMYWLERRSEEKARDHEAMAHLVARGAIPGERLEECFEKYGRREKIEGLENELTQLLKRGENKEPSGDFKNEFRKLSKKLSAEYFKFDEALIDEFRDRVDEEKKSLPKAAPSNMKEAFQSILAGIKESYREDRVGTVLSGAGIAGGLAVAVKSGFDVVEVVAPGSVPEVAGALGGKILSALVPCLGIALTAGAAYKAGKIIRDPNASKIDKVSSGVMALSTGLVAAGSIIPGLGFPLTVAGFSTMAGTALARWIAHKVTD